jgi:hypothetical protein
MGLDAVLSGGGSIATAVDVAQCDPDGSRFRSPARIYNVGRSVAVHVADRDLADRFQPDSRARVFGEAAMPVARQHDDVRQGRIGCQSDHVLNAIPVDVGEEQVPAPQLFSLQSPSGTSAGAAIIGGDSTADVRERRRH